MKLTDGPLVSLIVPVYKVDKYIHRCVDSILYQSYDHIEIILVDDGSPDDCPLICDQYADLDDRVLVVHQTNSGLSEARNAGIRIATGEYISFVDSDDYLDSQYVSKLVALVEQYDCSLAMCSFSTDDSSDIAFNDGVYSGLDILRFSLMNGAWWYEVAWNKLYEKSLLTDDFFPKGKINEDEFVFHSLVYGCKSIALTSDKLYHYSYNKDSITKSRMTIKSFDSIEARIDRLNFCIENKLEEFYQPAAKQLLHSFLYMVHECPIDVFNDSLVLQRANYLVSQMSSSAQLIRNYIAIKYYFLFRIIRLLPPSMLKFLLTTFKI